MIEILASLGFAVLFGLSAAIQKYSLNHMKKFSIKEMITNIKWLFSLAVGGAGIIVYLYALKNFSLGIVQPFLAVAILIPIIAGILFFKEKPNKYEAFCIFLIIVGVIWVSVM